MHGLLLAAGAGRRMGTPKALVVDSHGVPWLARTLGAMAAAGCDQLTVVLGAEAERAERLVPPGVAVARALDWETGMSASLRAGIKAATAGESSAILIHLVDLPDIGREVISRVVALGDDPGVLARAAFGGIPGHPVLLGRSHWGRACALSTGDAGAKEFLASRDVTLVECGDLATGRDVDVPSQIDNWRERVGE